MIARLGEIEIRPIDSLNRQQVIRALAEFTKGGSIEFEKPWLELQPTDRLRLLAARLYRVLRTGAARSSADLGTALAK